MRCIWCIKIFWCHTKEQINKKKNFVHDIKFLFIHNSMEKCGCTLDTCNQSLHLIMNATDIYLIVSNLSLQAKITNQYYVKCFMFQVNMKRTSVGQPTVSRVTWDSRAVEGPPTDWFRGAGESGHLTSPCVRADVWCSKVNVQPSLTTNRPYFIRCIMSVWRWNQKDWWMNSFRILKFVYLCSLIF